ncbi:hypothetical protein AAVH_31330 [Aphelenchoides avenae]|nr:hypothetical protein AAVH_31330 [Aphelenchus avenae]
MMLLTFYIFTYFLALSYQAEDHIIVYEAGLFGASSKLELETNAIHRPIFGDLQVPYERGITSFDVDRPPVHVINLLSRHGYRLHSAAGRPSFMYFVVVKEIRMNPFA